MMTAPFVVPNHEMMGHQPGGLLFLNFSVVNSDFPQKGGYENPHPADDDRRVLEYPI
jgi:hypothetical protein